MEVRVNRIKNLAQSSMQKVKIGATKTNDEAESSKPYFKYFQPKWCPLGLTKMQEHNLQRNWKIKQEAESYLNDRR